MQCSQAIPLSCGYNKVCSDEFKCEEISMYPLFAAKCNNDMFCGVLQCNERVCSECATGDEIDGFVCLNGIMQATAELQYLAVAGAMGWTLIIIYFAYVIIRKYIK